MYWTIIYSAFTITNCYNSKKDSNMIVGKKALNESGIIQWMIKNKQFFQTYGQSIGLLNEQNYRKALSGFRKYVERISPDGPAIRIDKIGTLYCQRQNKNEIKIRISYCSDFLIAFSDLEPQIHGQKKSREVDWPQIAGSIFLSQAFVKTVVRNYLAACLKLAMLEPDRKVLINLGILCVQIFRKKANLRQMKDVSQARENYKALDSSKYKKIETLTQIWKESLEGTLHDHLNIRKINQNLNKGASLTYKFSHLDPLRN